MLMDAGKARFNEKWVKLVQIFFGHESREGLHFITWFAFISLAGLSLVRIPPSSCPEAAT